MFVDVVFTYEEVDHVCFDQFAFFAVIDVLRATTTIVTALENGAAGVIPVPDKQSALRFAREGQDILLGGERQARKITGFDLGNSPLEYTRQRVVGKTVVLTTTNGTEAFRRVQKGLHFTSAPQNMAKEDENKQPVVAAACLRNGEAIVTALIDVCRQRGGGALFVCAGTDGRFSWEDALCAGLLVKRVDSLLPVRLGDGARAAKSFVDGKRAQLTEQLLLSAHARRLERLGYAADVRFCSRWHVSTAVPVLRAGTLTLQP